MDTNSREFDVLMVTKFGREYSPAAILQNGVKVNNRFLSFNELNQFGEVYRMGCGRQVSVESPETPAKRKYRRRRKAA